MDTKESVKKIINIIDDLYSNIEKRYNKNVASNACTFVIRFLLNNDKNSDDNILIERVTKLCEESKLTTEYIEISYQIIETLDTIIDIFDKDKSYPCFSIVINKLIEDKKISLDFD